MKIVRIIRMGEVAEVTFRTGKSVYVKTISQKTTQENTFGAREGHFEAVLRPFQGKTGQGPARAENAAR